MKAHQKQNRFQKIKIKMAIQFYYLLTILFLPMLPATAADSIYWDDGVSHTISDAAYEWDSIYLDYNIANNPGTHVDLTRNGIISRLSAFNNASVAMLSGSIDYVDYHDSSTLNMYGGFTIILDCKNSSEINIYGGHVSSITGDGSSAINIRGGEIPVLYALGDSMFNIYGYGFEYEPYGSATMLSGFWVNGDPFEIQLRRVSLPDDHYVLHTIPEPVTFLLLCTGTSLLFGRHRKSQ